MQKLAELDEQVATIEQKVMRGNGMDGTTHQPTWGEQFADNLEAAHG